jgi:hypothetical protein
MLLYLPDATSRSNCGLLNVNCKAKSMLDWPEQKKTLSVYVCVLCVRVG